MLVLDTPRYHLERSYEAPPPVMPGYNFSGYIGYDSNGLPIAASGREWSRIESDFSSSRLEKQERGVEELAALEERTAELIVLANLKAAAAQQQLSADISDLEWSNARARRINDQAGLVLREAAGRTLRARGRRGRPAPLVLQAASDMRHTPPAKVDVYQTVPNLPPPQLISCFAGVGPRSGP